MRGFMLNVTHYDWTRDNIRYGRKISARLGGKHFVISTAMNGRGPVHYMRGKRRINVHCHPLFRGAGPVPDHEDLGPVGGRLLLDQPRRLLGRLHATAARFPSAPGGPRAP